MPIIAPLLVLAGSTVVRRVVVGGVVYLVGSKVVAPVSDDLGEKQADLEAWLIEQGGEIVDEAAAAVGDVSLAFIRGFIPALIDGAQAGYEAIRGGFRGKEPETIAALTIVVLVAITFFTLLHEVKTGPGVAGEYAAGYRP